MPSSTTTDQSRLNESEPAGLRRLRLLAISVLPWQCASPAQSSDDAETGDRADHLIQFRWQLAARGD
jgi:hypothetical protein